MRTITMRVNNGIDELWFESDQECKLLAVMGAYGLSRSGWHSHHGEVTGDFETIEDVLQAYRINEEIIH